jgi:hypothetical protein
MAGTDKYSGILFRIMCFGQQLIRQYEIESHGCGDVVSEKDCSFVDGGGQTLAFLVVCCAKTLLRDVNF